MTGENFFISLVKKICSLAPYWIKIAFIIFIKDRFFTNSPIEFPLKISKHRETFVGDTIFNDYYVQYYEESEIFPVIEKYSYNYKTEILKGKKIKKNCTLIIDETSVLPISINDRQWLQISSNNKDIFFQNPVSKRFHYFTFSSGARVKVQSDKDFIIGAPLLITQPNSHKYKRVIFLFVDGFAFDIFDNNSFEKTMPNTYKFFKNGLIFNKCYSNAEWSLPSLANIFLSKYTANHEVFHPRKMYDISSSYKPLSEYFHDDGYLTFQACGNWRKSPLYGYVKGFDRTIYKKQMEVQDVIFSFFENERAFPDRDIFSWCTFFDLHHMINGVPSLAEQIELSCEAHDYNETNNEKSVFKIFDRNKKEQYSREVGKIDYYLDFIYDYINNKFNNNALVVLCSDHGQAYLSEENHPLSDCRTRVPLMIRGKDIPSGICDEYIENIDILPSILTLAGIHFDGDIDGRVPKIFGGESERSFVYSESLFPSQTYKAVIRGKDHKFLFETTEFVNEDGKVDISKYQVALNYIDGNESTLVTTKHNENKKSDEYIELVKEHMKNHIV